jgi:transposase-like protein
MNSSKQRRHFEGPEKVAIVKRHLIDKVPISNLADELELQPTQIYDWIKKFFENGHLAFGGDRKSKAAEDAKDRKIEQLEAKVTRKNEVMAELMEAHAELKKNLGEI